MKTIKEALGATVQCCICGKTITGETPLKIELALPQENYQSLFAHGQCMRAKLHPSVPFMTPKEYEQP